MPSLYRHPYKEVPVNIDDTKSLPFFDSLVLNYLRFSTLDRGLGENRTNVSNRELCEAFGVSERYVSLAISRLRKAGKVNFETYDGISRVLSIVPHS